MREIRGSVKSKEKMDPFKFQGLVPVVHALISFLSLTNNLLLFSKVCVSAHHKINTDLIFVRNEQASGLIINLY